MSVFKELNNLHDTDKVAFEVLIDNISDNLDSDSREEFDDIEYQTSEIAWNEHTLIFGERAVRENYANGGGITHVESSLYYMLDKDGKLLTDNASIQTGMNAMREHIDSKYS